MIYSPLHDKLFRGSGFSKRVISCCVFLFHPCIMIQSNIVRATMPTSPHTTLLITPRPFTAAQQRVYTPQQRAYHNYPATTSVLYPATAGVLIIPRNNGCIARNNGCIIRGNGFINRSNDVNDNLFSYIVDKIICQIPFRRRGQGIGSSFS